MCVFFWGRFYISFCVENIGFNFIRDFFFTKVLKVFVDLKRKKVFYELIFASEEFSFI